MPRTKDFDRDEVLVSALELFWEKGYDTASMSALTAHMGIGRASLYDTFGSKHALFTEALQRYCERVEQELLAPLRRRGPPRRVLAGFFAGLVDAHVQGTRPSCLVVKSAVTLGRTDPDTAATVRRVTRRIEDAFHALLVRGAASGELADRADPRALARFFTNIAQGLVVTGSIRRDRSVLEDIVRTALAVLD